MPKHTSSSAPKKARWSTEKKATATKKPHRGQGPASAGSASRPASSSSSHVGGREWRAPRDEQRSSDRGGYQRRDDRPSFSRDDRSSDRGARPERGGYQRRDDRPSAGRDSRDDRGGYQRRDDRPAFNRDSRSERPSFSRDDRSSDRGARPERGGYQRRDDRPAYDRGARPERGGYQGRDDRRSSERPRFERNDRSDGGSAGFDDAEAERMDADTWTKSTRADVSDGPVEVSADNGFAALGLPERLVERLAREGISAPFPIQTATIPDALAGKDVLGRGQTGSGKT
ncbi:MAG: DEAD/DEAH box helicase, partial [Humibacillus sp.]